MTEQDKQDLFDFWTRTGGFVVGLKILPKFNITKQDYINLMKEYASLAENSDLNFSNEITYIEQALEDEYILAQAKELEQSMY